MSHSDSEINPDILNKRRNAGTSFNFKPRLKRYETSRKTFKHKQYESYYKIKLKELRNKNLLGAASLNNTEDLVRQIHLGASPNHADEHGRSALHIAASKGYTEVVRVLLESGANPNCFDRLSNTPLHLAACTHNLAIISLLLKAGASAKLLDGYGKNPLELAESKLQLLQKNFRQGSMEIIHVLAELKLIITLITTYIKQQKTVDLKDMDLELNKLNLNTETVEEVDQQMSKVLNELQGFRINT